MPATQVQRLKMIRVVMPDQAQKGKSREERACLHACEAGLIRRHVDARDLGAKWKDDASCDAWAQRCDVFGNASHVMSGVW